MKAGLKNKIRLNIVELILGTVEQFGESIPRMLAMNARKNYRLFRESRLKKSISPAYINETIRRLQSQGMIQLKVVKNKQCFTLTDRGRLKLGQFKLEGVDIKEPKKWDGRWRVVIFDISESKKGLRDILRRNLVRIGFERLQNSVWLYPYDCEELINLLKTDFRLGEDVLYMTVDYLENEERIKKLFDL